MTVNLIWAQSRNRVIGRDGTMPWHLPEDLARFRSLTTGATVVMGRRTWESLPARFRPLPNRHNVVLSQDASYDARGALVVTSLEAALETADELWVIGGGTVYAAVLPRADALFVTDVDVEVTGDAHAPDLRDEWQQVGCDPRNGWHTSTSGLRYRFRELRRVSS